jgi:hypothetical protein
MTGAAGALRIIAAVLISAFGVAARAGADCGDHVAVRRVEIAGCRSCWAVDGVALVIARPGPESPEVLRERLAQVLAGAVGVPVRVAPVAPAARVFSVWRHDDGGLWLERVSALARALEAGQAGAELGSLIESIEPNIVYGADPEVNPTRRAIVATAVDAEAGKEVLGPSKLAVLDSGVDGSSPAGALVADAVDCGTCEGLARGVCRDGWQLDEDPDGHGTCVAAQSLDSAGLVGTDEPVVLAVRVARGGITTAAALVGGIDAALRREVATVVVPHAGACPSKALRRALEAAAEKSLVFVSTPNAAVDLDASPIWPASYGWPLVVPISAADVRARPARVSRLRSYGRTVVARAHEFVEPSARTWARPNHPAGACTASGTSFAVAAAAGLAMATVGPPSARLEVLLQASAGVDEAGLRTCTGRVLGSPGPLGGVDLNDCFQSAHVCEGRSWVPR